MMTVVGMAVCMIAILLFTNAWLGEMVGAAMEGDEPHPLAYGALAATGVAIVIYIWLASNLTT